jgi:site-specific recombinase XerD
MIALIDLYRKKLLKVNGFAASTVETYTISIKAFCNFAKNELKTDPVKVKGPQLLQWISYLKNTGIGNSRMENHHYALKSFFTFLQKTGDSAQNRSQPGKLLNCLIHSIKAPGMVCEIIPWSLCSGLWA